MRTNVDIDPELMKQAMNASGQKTMKATIEEALRRMVRLAEQKKAGESMAGLGWVGDLDKMRGERRF